MSTTDDVAGLVERLLDFAGHNFSVRLVCEAIAALQSQAAEIARLRAENTDLRRKVAARKLIADELANAGDERQAAIVAWLREEAEWHEKHDDGLSGFDRIAQGHREAVDAIESGEWRR